MLSGIATFEVETSAHGTSAESSSVMMYGNGTAKQVGVIAANTMYVHSLTTNVWILAGIC